MLPERYLLTLLLPCADSSSVVSHFHPLPCLPCGQVPSHHGQAQESHGFLHGLLSVSPTLDVGSRQVCINRRVEGIE